MENALLFMLVIFSLSALITSLTLIGHYQVKIENITLLQDVEIDQIGEDYLASIAKKQTFTPVYENYDYSVSGNALSVWRTGDNPENVVLYVEAERTADGQVNVIKWRYSLLP